jgi:hypothetical protein
MVSVATERLYITPKGEFLPCYVTGNAYRDKPTNEVHDELECTFLVIKVDDKTLIWGIYDLIFVDLELSTKLRKALSEKYGVPYEQITIGAIHTHTGPEISEENVFGMADVKVVPGYRDFLFEQGMKAVENCYSKGFTEVTPYVQTLMVDGIYSNRNGKELVADKCVTILKFKDSVGKIVAGCVNLACHPTVNDPYSTAISGDIFGYISRGIEKRWGVSPLMMQGASGDMGNRQYRQGASQEEVSRVGEGILEQIDTKASSEQAIDFNKVQVEPYHYIDEFDKSDDDIAELQKEIDDDESKLNGDITDDARRLLVCGLAFLRKQVQERHVKNEFDASIIRLGDLEICQIPAELFSCFGLKIKEASRAKYSFIWGYANDDAGYLVERDMYDKCYEGRSTPYRIGEPERLTEDLVKLMSK